MTSQITAPPTITRGFFVNGRWIEEGRLVDVRAPYDQQVLGQVYEGSREHALLAIAAAIRAFETTRRLPAFERQRVLRDIAKSLTERKEEFAKLLAQEAGKPIRTARLEVERAIFTFNVAEEEST